jgi:hypothetical protein
MLAGGLWAAGIKRCWLMHSGKSIQEGGSDADLRARKSARRRAPVRKLHALSRMTAGADQVLRFAERRSEDAL